MEVETVVWQEHSVDATGFRRALISWGQSHFRDFPWRHTSDPYEVLIAEILLHRTRAEQVRPIYDELLSRYPDMKTLAGADPIAIERLLYPLGLRWRTRLLLEMALAVAERFDGQVPLDRESLVQLPGISDYIASATRCFALDEPEPILDTNTVRVIGRVFGMRLNDHSRRSRAMRDVMTAMLDRTQPRKFNFALLDLGALVCRKAQNPECKACPVSSYCRYARIAS